MQKDRPMCLYIGVCQSGVLENLVGVPKHMLHCVCVLCCAVQESVRGACVRVTVATAGSART